MPKIMIIDPKKNGKKKVHVGNATFNKDDSRQVRSGSAATLSRDKQGKIIRIKNKNHVDVDAPIAEGYDAKRKAQEGDKTFSGNPAPRGGGPKEDHVTASGTAKKKLIIRSIKNVRKSDASPAAKRAAIRIHRKK